MSVVEAGLQVAAVEATACPLCAADSDHAAHTAKPAEAHNDHLLPWLIALTISAVITSVGIASERWFGLGTAAGLLAGAFCAMQSVSTVVRRHEQAQEREVKLLKDDADSRVSMVIRQFEWAVNDVAKLRRDQERAQVTADLLLVQGRARERHVRKLEREILDSREREAKLAVMARTVEARAEFEPAVEDVYRPVRMQWALHFDGSTTRIELECDARSHRPTRLRVVGPDGEVQTKTMTPMHSGDGTLWFALAEPPADLVADLLAGREPAHRLEAQVDYEWRAVLLEDTGRRTRIKQDKHGRTFRVSEAPAFERVVVPATPQHNPFDHTFETSYTL
ncbi:MAG TPA: hypothetical protein VEP48_11320 [Methylomirabilota bacterium]|nr:hypothetical protein [Methylomirabilota bacterium]